MKLARVRRHSIVGAAWLVCVFLTQTSPPGYALIAGVDEADDVCPPTANPCTITQVVQLVDGAVLDFGQRSVRLEQGGTISVGAGSAVIRCGEFVTTVGDTTALEVRGPVGDGSIDGGVLTLVASRTCSNDGSQTCTSDADCRLGACLPGGTCENDPARSCATPEHCELGSCAIGVGNVSIDGRIRAEGRRAGAVVIRAAGHIQLEREINLGASGAGFDGGTLELDAGSGDVLIGGPVRAEGGSGAQGGTLVVTADSAVQIDAPIVVTGGEFDGGLIEIVSGGDTLIGATLDARATGGGGGGGDVTVEGGGAVVLAAGASVLATGHSARTGGLAGDGGSVELRGIAGVSAAPDTTIRVDAASPDGSGGIIAIDGGSGVVAMDGILSARGLGTEGGGGSIEILGGSVALGGTSALDVRGGSEGAGAVTIRAQSDLAFGGVIEATASNSGAADRVSLQAGTELAFGGAVRIGAQTGLEGFDGDVVIAGCLVDILSLGTIENSGTFGRNTLRANDVVRIRRGAQISALTPWGRNEIVLGPDAQEPIIFGSVSPAPEVRTDPDLTVCGVCGNGRIDPGETCDDGNTSGGDGCASTCQHEGCIAQTLGWPDQHLCNDGLECTQDSCNTEAGECQYAFACDDGHACTIDACAIDGSCAHEPDDSLCNDGNPCTKDVCLVTAGCVGFAQDKPCDDGRACTGDDVCSEGICRGESLCGVGEHCSNVTGGCEFGTTTSTTTSTTLPAVCGNGVEEAGEDCDDGDTSWSLGEYCRANCTRVSCGDPDDSGLVRVTDALVILRAAIGVARCADCICDVDADGKIVARDALVVLRTAVGSGAELVCPACRQ